MTLRLVQIAMNARDDSAVGRFWALGPARLLARFLSPTRIRPNAVTLASGGLVLAASALVAFNGPAPASRWLASAALALAHQYQPTAITLDVFLPDMLGWTVLNNLKHNATTRHIPVQIISVEEERSHALTRGAFAYTVKPATASRSEAAAAWTNWGLLSSPVIRGVRLTSPVSA